jgi:hypothetical protein
MRSVQVVVGGELAEDGLQVAAFRMTILVEAFLAKGAYHPFWAAFAFGARANSSGSSLAPPMSPISIRLELDFA